MKLIATGLATILGLAKAWPDASFIPSTYGEYADPAGKPTCIKNLSCSLLQFCNFFVMCNFRPNWTNPKKLLCNKHCVGTCELMRKYYPREACGAHNKNQNTVAWFTVDEPNNQVCYKQSGWKNSNYPNKCVTITNFIDLPAMAQAGKNSPACPISMKNGTTRKKCKTAQFDLTILVDGSGSVTAPNFDVSCDFVKDLVNMFPIGANAVRGTIMQFAAASYSNQVPVTYCLNSGVKSTVLGSIATMKANYMGGGTEIGQPLSQITGYVNGANRPGVKQVVIVLTDGVSYDNLEYPSGTDAAAGLLATSASVFAIGVGSGVDTTQLDRIGTGSDHVYSLAGFNALDSVKTSIAHDACVPATPTPTPTPTPLGTNPTNTAVQSACSSAEFDLTLLVDGSGSVGAGNYATSCDFIQDLVDLFTVDPAGTRATVIQFASGPTSTYCTQEGDSATVNAAIASMKASYISGGTAVATALVEIAGHVSTGQAQRPGKAQIVVVLTDGGSGDDLKVGGDDKAVALLATGAKVYVIGVGTGINTAQCDRMGSDPDADHVFTVGGFAQLGTVKNNIAGDACT